MPTMRFVQAVAFVAVKVKNAKHKAKVEMSCFIVVVWFCLLFILISVARTAATFAFSFVLGNGFCIRGLGLVVVVTMPASAAMSSSTSTASAMAAFVSLGCIFRRFAEFGGHGFLGHFFFKETLYLTEERLVFLAYERHGAAVLSCTCRSSDTVHVIFLVVRNIVVYHELNIIDVYASCHDVCCHKDIYLSCLETVHDIVALLLHEV